MSSDTEVFIKTEIDDDSQEIDIKEYIKVEVKENSELEGKVYDENDRIREFADEGLMIAVNEQKHTDLVITEVSSDNAQTQAIDQNIKTKSLDSLKGKYNSQLEEYLRLAQIRKSTEHEIPSQIISEKNLMLLDPIEDYDDDAKSIIPSRKRQRIRRAEREESKKLDHHIAKESQSMCMKVVQTIKSPMIDQKRSENVEDPKKVAHKKRKVHLERERRKGLTQLFDELDYWVDLGDKDDLYCEPRLTRFQKLPYYERTNAASRCIANLESSIQFKESVIQSLQIRNCKLQSKLESLKGFNETCLDQDALSYKPLYNCDHCTLSHNSIQDAFIHSESHTLSGRRHLPLKTTTTPGSVECMVYKCKDCPTVCLNSYALQIHKFLHQDLTYFFCPDCQHIFGMPSKLKRHYFLSHGNILGSEHQYILDMNSRIEITKKVQEYMTTSDNNKMEVVDNFLDASIDAKLIMDEIMMNEEVENIPSITLKDLLSEYLNMDTGTEHEGEEEETCNQIIPKCEDVEFEELPYIKTEKEQ